MVVINDSLFLSSKPGKTLQRQEPVSLNIHINAVGNRQKIVPVVAAAPEAKEEIASLVSTPREKQFAGVL